MAWLREVLLVVGFYNIYQVIRGQADLGARARAFRHANWVVDAERAMRLFVEQPVQQAVLAIDWFMAFTNAYYGTVHFAATGGVLVWLFFRRHRHYHRMRTTLAAMTLLGLVTFLAFPLAPPRMLPCNDDIPAASGSAPLIGECFVDSLQRAGGVWSYESPVAKAIANQFAAMPSLHFGWALWCGAALLLHGRARTTRIVGVAHVAFTLFAVVATANHYLLDAVGGAVVYAAAWRLSGAFDRRRSTTAEGRVASDAATSPSTTEPHASHVFADTAAT